MTFGGGTVKSITWTESWGQSPGSGQATVLGDFNIETGQDFAVTIGGATIYGVVKNPVLDTDADSGEVWTVPLVDNREKLAWDTLQGSFNATEIVEVDPAAYGAVRRRRYKHVLPNDWHAQIITYTDNPLTAAEILDYIFDADELSFSWTYVNHSRLSNPVYNIDADTGSSLGNLVQSVLEKLGLLMAMNGEFQLKFCVKGDGALPSYEGNNIKEFNIGEALSNQAPAVRIIGDRNLYQVLRVDLYRGWETAWEDYLFEGDWIDAVKTEYGMPATTPSERAMIASKARTITVGDWVEKTSNDLFSDHQRFGDVSRMSIPAWVYITEVVFKAYNIGTYGGSSDISPDGYPSPDGLNGIELRNLKLRDGLLARVTYDPDDGTLLYFQESGQYQLYTDDKAFIIAKGQPVDLTDPAKRDVLDPESTEGLRDKWFVQSKFKMDHKNYSIIFDDPVFEISETEGEGLFEFVNAESDLPVDHPSKYLVVPNAGARIYAAQVRAAFCFEAERYHRDFGSGLRKTSNYVSGLSLHTLMEEGAFKTEIKYDTDPEETADQKAQKAASSFLAKTDTYASGSFTRVGSAGTTLSPSIDRVSYTYNTSGLSETVDFTKERGPDYFESERELERRNLSDELYPGMRENREAAKDLEYMSRVLAGLQTKTDATQKYKGVNDVWQTPVGNTHSAPTTLFPATAYEAGELIFTDDTGTPDVDGAAFQGVVVCAGCAADKAHPVATQGVVPVKIVGPCNPGDTVGVNAGDKIARVGGARPIGQVMEKYEGTQTIRLPVRLGGSAAAATTAAHPFKVVKPKYTGGGEVPADWKLKRMVLYGTANNKPPTNLETNITFVANQWNRIWGSISVSSGGALTAFVLASGTTIPESAIVEDGSGTIVFPIYSEKLDASGNTELDGSGDPLIIQHAKTDYQIRRYLSEWTCSGHTYGYFLDSIG